MNGEIFKTSQNNQRPHRPWLGAVKLGLKLGLVGAVIYLATVYYIRWTRVPLEPSKPEEVKIPSDYYVYPPRSYVSDASSAKRLVGMPLWVKEGYRWSYQPGGGMLGPLETITPTAIRRRGGDVLLEFDKGGKACTIAISSGGRFFVDEIFLLKDPRELYTHWPAEIWKKIEAHEIEVGMTEYQIVFSVGAGNVVRSSSNQVTRIVEYTLGQVAGLQPVRVTYRDGVAQRIEPLRVE